MQFLRSVLGTGTATKDFPYNIGDAYASSWGTWTHYQGTSKEDGSQVSIFALNATDARDARVPAARNGVKRLRTVRHPNILTFIHSTEIEKDEGGVTKPTIYIVTEPVMPLSEKIRELNLDGTQRDEYYAWGLHQIAKAVSFLSNDCKLVHGNVCLDAVVVTPTLDWKLHAFDVLSEFDGANPNAEGPMLQYDWLVGSQYKSMELAKSDWALIRKSPPYAIDSWGLGCFIHELFSAKKLSRTEELRVIASIPKKLLPDYQRLLGSVPSRRMNPSKLIENSEFFQNKLVDTIQFMDVLNLKDSVEKDNFFRKLPTLTDQLPKQIVTKKVLPQLASGLEFGSAPASALQTLLKVGSWLPPDEFTSKIIPCITKLFSSTDRTIRINLLQHIDSFGAHISSTIIDEQIFNHVSSGFSDSSAFLRELTLKSMLVLAPKLSQRTLTGNLLKYLSKLQVDEEPAIRTNTTILLGNIAKYLNDATRKRVLINAFTMRALRDTFPPARSAGVLALMATFEYYDVNEISTRILPSLCVLLVDPDNDVRSKALQGCKKFLHAVEDSNNKVESVENTNKVASPASTPIPTTQVSSSILSWAVSSFTSKTATSTASTAPSPAPSSSSLQPSSITSSNSSQKIDSVSSHSSLPSLDETNGKLDDENYGWDTSKEKISQKNDIPGQELFDNEQDDENDGWDDLEVEEPSLSSISRIQTAQQKPLATSKPSITAAPSPSIPSSISSSRPRVSVEPTTETRKFTQKEGSEDDLWADIAAPAPVSSAKPVSMNRAKPAGVRAGSHVRLPAQSGEHVSLQAVLGGASGSSGSSRGRGRGIPKLGAQRISQ